MMRNSNQNAVGRLAKLPMVRSACGVLSVLYVDTKCSHPSLKLVCEVVEGGVTAVSSVAYDSVSPVVVKLEAQISIANYVACKGLDWLETAFPLLQKPTEQVAASAKNKMLEVKDCVQHPITWVVGRMQQVTDPTRKMADDGVEQSPVKKAVSEACLRLDAALSMSEALVDHVFPPTKEDLEEEVKTVEGFDAAAVRTSYPVRLFSLTAKLCTRTYHKVMESVSRASSTPPDQLADFGLEPQRLTPAPPAPVSIAINVACKGLDWLETAFPLLQKPTEQVAASAKNKMLEVKDCVQHPITWAVGRMQRVTDPTRKMADDWVEQSLVNRAVTVACLRLDASLSMSEALVDHVFPPTKEDLEKKVKTVEGFDAAAVRTSYPVRLFSLTAKLCTRTYHKVGTKVKESVSRASSTPPDQLADFGLEPPRLTPAPPAPGCVCALPHLTDVHPKRP